MLHNCPNQNGGQMHFALDSIYASQKRPISMLWRPLHKTPYIDGWPSNYRSLYKLILSFSQYYEFCIFFTFISLFIFYKALNEFNFPFSAKLLILLYIIFWYIVYIILRILFFKRISNQKLY